MDGPDTTPLPLIGSEMIVFAVEVSEMMDLYVAYAPDFHGPFTAHPLSINTLGFNEDDPALSPDGALLVYGSDKPGAAGTGGGWDLWLARATADGNFKDLSSTYQEKFAGYINTPAIEAAPDLAYLTVGGDLKIELYFDTDRDGGNSIYRASCTLVK
jgi:hypothetical protein